MGNEAFLFQRPINCFLQLILQNELDITGFILLEKNMYIPFNGVTRKVVQLAPFFRLKVFAICKHIVERSMKHLTEGKIRFAMFLHLLTIENESNRKTGRGMDSHEIMKKAQSDYRTVCGKR